MMTDEQFLRMNNADFAAHMEAALAELVRDTGCKNPAPYLVVQWARSHPGTALHALFNFEDDQTDSERAADFEWYQLECAKLECPTIRRLH